MKERLVLCGALLTLSSLMLGCSSSGGSGGSEMFSVTNPYAPLDSQRTSEVQVNTLRVFGDSYSADTSSRGRTWSAFLVEKGVATQREVYAVGGASAAVNGGSTSQSFLRQAQTWENRGAPIQAGDLTAVYFGYNDIWRTGSSDNLAAAKTGFAAGLNTLIGNGAATQDQRIFLTQIHDWSKNPGVEPIAQGDVLSWNAHIAQVANSSPNLMAVDLYTVFERVYQNPEQFGFTNVTDANPARAGVDYLYHDVRHFGTKGQALIARVYEHYLTRGWDWANSLNAGASASRRLAADVNSGLLNLSLTAENPTYSGLTVRAIDVAPLAQKDASDIQLEMTHSGSLLAYGVSLLAESRDANSAALVADGMTAHLRNTLANGTRAVTLFSMVDHDHTDLTNDFLTDDVVRNRFSGSSVSLQQTFLHPLVFGNFALVPWLSLDHAQHSLNAATLRSPYTSDAQFSATDYSELLGGAGVEAKFSELNLQRLGRLDLSGSLGFWQELWSHNPKVQITESALPGVVQRETIRSPSMQTTRLGLGAKLQLDPQTALELDFVLQNEPSGSQEFFGLSAIRRF